MDDVTDDPAPVDPLASAALRHLVRGAATADRVRKGSARPFGLEAQTGIPITSTLADLLTAPRGPREGR